MKKVVPIWRVVVKDGKLLFHDKAGFQQYLGTLQDECQLVLKKWYKNRTDKENRYYWGVVVRLIADEVGEENKDNVHDFIQLQVGNSADVAGVKVPAGTSHMTTAEFEDYATRVRNWASKELHVFVPLPNEAESYDMNP